MNDLIQLNKFAKLHNGENIFFCKTDYIERLFERLRHYRTPSILITGNSDYSITDQHAMMAPRCIRRWYAQNAEALSPLVVGIPMGIENHEECVLPGHGVGWQHAVEKAELLSDPPEATATRGVYANFSLETHPSRSRVRELCEGLEFITTKVSEKHSEINKRSYKEYISDILEHKMAVCPRGNGVDCHRVWEVLYLGRVPIIKRTPAMRHFEQLPILFLDDWEQVRNFDMLEQEYHRVRNNQKDILYMSFWNNKVGEES